jgi:iron complex outermembrane receptor protein
VEYAQALNVRGLTLRVAFDRFTYDGTYPFAGDSAEAMLVAHDSVVGTRWSAEARFVRPLRARQLFTLGAQFIDNIRQNQHFGYIEPAVVLFATNRSSLQEAVYIQDEIKLARWLIANAGLRYDRYEAFERVTPRAALIIAPTSNQSLKYLYGRAFRAPNEYERNVFYFGDGTQTLRPESVDTHELVWERYTNDWLRTSLSGYWYKADGLITLRSDPSTFLGTTYVNGGHVRASGVELEAQMRLRTGSQGVMSYALQRARDSQTGAALVNSPGQMGKVRFSGPGPGGRVLMAGEVLAVSSRRTVAGDTLKPATTASATVTVPIGAAFQVVGTVANLFNVQYADPASDAHRQDVIGQNGRTFRIGATWKLWARE